MNQEVLDFLCVNVEGIGEIFVKVNFHPFPHSCYHCKATGHFTKNCPKLIEKDEPHEESKENVNEAADSKRKAQVEVAKKHEEYVQVKSRRGRARNMNAHEKTME